MFHYVRCAALAACACRRYAQLICSVLTLHGGSGSDWGVGGGGETMIQHDVNLLRAEMTGTCSQLAAGCLYDAYVSYGRIEVFALCVHSPMHLVSHI